jgi:diguanylate cyclase (GGDEF)-like protein
MSELSSKSSPRVVMRKSSTEESSERAHSPEGDNASGAKAPEAAHIPSSRRRRASDAPDEDLLTLSGVEEKLRAATRENEFLKLRNRQLARALADASQRGTAAHHLAHHDVLTGLPNRLLLMERLQDSISAASHQQLQVALLFIDLDDFKYVNDHLGHTVGDKLLMIVAARILASIRSDDIACRYGGDEFVVLMPKIRDSSLVDSIAEKIRGHIDGCYGIDDKEVHVSASIGFAVYPTHGDHCDALLNHADASMYRSKATRCGRSEIRPPDASLLEQSDFTGHRADGGTPKAYQPNATHLSQRPSLSTMRQRRRTEKS